MINLLMLAVSLWIIVPFSSLATSPASDCEPGWIIETGQGRSFRIELDSNPTTGYGWEAQWEHDFLTLVRKDFKRKKAPEGLVGVPGKECFTFKALRKGAARIEFVYQRPWETEYLKKRAFVVIIR